MLIWAILSQFGSFQTYRRLKSDSGTSRHHIWHQVTRLNLIQCCKSKNQAILMSNGSDPTFWFLRFTVNASNTKKWDLSCMTSESLLLRHIWHQVTRFSRLLCCPNKNHAILRSNDSDPSFWFLRFTVNASNTKKLDLSCMTSESLDFCLDNIIID